MRRGESVRVGPLRRSKRKPQTLVCIIIYFHELIKCNPAGRWVELSPLYCYLCLRRPCLLFCTRFVSCLSQIRIRFVPDCSRFVPVLSPFSVRFGSIVCISHVRVVVYFICTSFCPFRESVSFVCLRFLLFYCIVSVVICSFCRCICAVHSSAELAVFCVMFWFMLRACCHASNRRFMLCSHWSICCHRVLL